MALQFYNTLTRQLDEFKSLKPGKAKLYTCGPTVYNFAHIGNFRAYIFEDLLRRTLKYCGYQVIQVTGVVVNMSFHLAIIACVIGQWNCLLFSLVKKICQHMTVVTVTVLAKTADTQDISGGGYSIKCWVHTCSPGLKFTEIPQFGGGKFQTSPNLGAVHFKSPTIWGW